MHTLVHLLPVLIPLGAAFVSTLGTIASLLALAAPGRLPNPRRKVHYNVHYDAFIAQRAESEIEGLAKLIVQRPDGVEVLDPSVTMIRISNDGGLDIVEHDWSREIEFAFDGREVEGVEVSKEYAGATLREAIVTHVAENSRDKKKLRLPKIALNKKDRFRLLVLLSGNRANPDPKEYGVSGDAYLHNAVPGVVSSARPGRARP
jgi:phosphate transport system substrate-binding protein